MKKIRAIALKPKQHTEMLGMPEMPHIEPIKCFDKENHLTHDT